MSFQTPRSALKPFDPEIHVHICNDCQKWYDCQDTHCRKLKGSYYAVCPGCYLKAKNSFNEYKAYTVTRINDPADEEIKKGHKKLFNPRPNKPTLHEVAKDDPRRH